MRISGLALLLTLTLGCGAAPTPTEPPVTEESSLAVTATCRSDLQCPAAKPACQPSGVCGKCSATNTKLCKGATPFCNTSTGLCAACQTNANCSGSKPVCSAAQTCTACKSDSQCSQSSPACLASGACGQCSASNKTACTGATKLCNTSTNKCVACLANTDCGGSTPICDAKTKACVPCTKSTQCPSSAPICQAGACVQCTASSKAACKGSTPYCDAGSNKCVGCTSSATCSGNTPVCSAQTHVCSVCTADSQCGAASPACAKTGACVQCTATSMKACTGGTPICDPLSNLCVACPRSGCPTGIPSCQLNTSVVNLAAGGSANLSWNVIGATTISIDQGLGTRTDTSVVVKPSKTTLYTLTATNYFGTCTSAVTINVGAPPVISAFTATPSALVAGQSSNLAWTVTGQASLSINQGVGAVTGTSKSVRPGSTTTYTLTASNSFGNVTKAATVSVGVPPVINRFWSSQYPAGPGVPGTLYWDVTGATVYSIDNGVGTVTGTSKQVYPSAATTYTLTATNAYGAATAQAKVGWMPLTKLTNTLYASENVLFIIPASGTVTWTGSASWDSVYSQSNIQSYVTQLKARFPADYFMVVVTANNLLPNKVPNVLTPRHHADGIGQGAITGTGVPNICRFNLGGGTVIDGAFGVLDHEVGHNWGVFIGSEVAAGHWHSNSTVPGQMAASYSDDGGLSSKLIAGTPAGGFTWSSMTNIARNETEIFSDQDLYLMGLAEKFPDVYVLASPVYNSDHTMSYASVATYNQAWVEARNGVRSPSYKVSPKQFKFGFVYVARDLAEIQTVYQPIERSVFHFANDEVIDKAKYRFQVPFLAETKHRASIDSRLADYDGNHAPKLALPEGGYYLSPDGYAVVPYTASDVDGAAPTVSCVPADDHCVVSNGSVLLDSLTPGTHFFTIKAEDAGGKKAFAHFVVDAS